MKKLIVRTASFLILTVLMMSAITGMRVQAAFDEVPPEVVSSSVSPRIIAYQGNSSIPGYTSVEVKTNEPTRGYITVEGNSSSARINLSTTDFKAAHAINWAPWDDAKRQPLQPGDYVLKLHLWDEGYNQISGYPMGKLTVVGISNPAPLIWVEEPHSPVFSPRFDDVQPKAVFNYRLARHAEVQLVIRQNGSEVYHGPKEKLSPGYHNSTWFGKNDAGTIVPDGAYEVILKTIELNYNYPATTPTEFKLGTITVKDGVNESAVEKLRQMITDARFNENLLTPNQDGSQDRVSGSITLSEPAKIAVYVANMIDRNVNLVLTHQDLAAGTHTFAWDGKDAWGGMSPNGTYYLRVSIEKDGAYTTLDFKDQQVTVKESYDVQIPQPAQRIKVTAATADMTVMPMAQGYKAKDGDIFTILKFATDPFRYEVLVRDNIVGSIRVTDVELIDLDAIPDQTGLIVKSGVKAYSEPYADPQGIEQLEPNTRIRILRQDHTFYRVVLPSGKQGYVPTGDVTIVKDDAGSGTIHTVVAGDTLWKIAQKYGVSTQAIIDANQLDPSKYLYVGQKLRIPNVQPAPQTQAPAIEHVVQSGDTLWKIAQKYGVSTQAIIDANQLDPSKYLYVGQKLRIPNVQPAPQTQTPAVVHVVQSGDTLWKIAQKYGVSIQSIVDANKLDSAQYLYVGQKLVITSAPSAPQTQAPAVVHVVQSGDTLWKIAQKYGVSIQGIVDSNKLDPTQYLYVGQKLTIPTK